MNRTVFHSSFSHWHNPKEAFPWKLTESYCTSCTRVFSYALLHAFDICLFSLDNSKLSLGSFGFSIFRWGKQWIILSTSRYRNLKLHSYRMGTICCLSLSSWGIESMGWSRNETHLQLFGRTALHLFLTPGQQGPFKPTISNKTRSFPGKTHWSLVKKTWSWAMLHFFPGLSHVQRNDKLHSIAPLICIFLVSW